ncbi:MAG: tripartite tricarboxylate transporter substrate binding protein [Betaproteobacteria bacterium]|nr:tripartite tricarboxylate transporter substrate binding protein [Betaproteobacteria bacterium]
MLRSFSKAVFLAFTVLPAATTLGASYPQRPIRLVVPYPPGGAADVLSRVLAEPLREELKQPVVVDNRGGAGGNIAMELVAGATSDGYTLIMANAPTLAINPTLYAHIRFDPVRDFAPTSLIAKVPLFVLVQASSPVKSVKQLISMAKEKPNALSYAIGGNGSVTQLSAALFAERAGIKLRGISYKGSAPALVGLMSAETDCMFDLMPSSMPFVKSGRLRALAVTSSTRSALAPGLPTIAELGLPGYEASSWFGVMAPAKTPTDILARLNHVIVNIVKSHSFQQKLVTLGAEPAWGTQSEFAAYIKSEGKKWGQIVTKLGLRIE